MPKKQHERPYDIRKAVRVIRDSDQDMATLIERVGPCRLQVRSSVTPFHALLRSVIYQQLSGKAAGTIYSRTLDLFSYRRPTPSKVLRAGENPLRGAGLSRAKTASILDLAEKTLDGTIPSSTRLRRMPDDDVINTLVRVRGIGQWTVQMLLIFHLGRADVLPGTDLGVRKGLQLTFGLQQLPTPEQVLRYGDRWRPYRSVASWYLWRANDL